MENILEILSNYLEADPEDLECFYDDSMELIRGAATHKNIEFDGYFRERWEISADTVFEFDEEYFENKDRRDLYVFLSALVDKDIYSYLEYAWPFTQNEKLTEVIIKDKIQQLKEKGVRF
ncbi:hypothetical protein SAMN05421866_3470 [Chryseobacterium oranimense]|uniref:Uncharacterized protein n=1 Tax=Chryseobacterium oranimense TaxID=421058 RepID=A0A1M5V023_9FLAO|nr:hypothetical protein [Chryseobacterium oranimense]SHH68494.1 hypothetical protein SAMN05421866_3470 [Chryseobacterium oranimense]